MTIGFIGAVTDELPSLVSPDGIADLTVGDPTEAANRVANQLSDGKDENGEADIVVLLVHEGAATPTGLRDRPDARGSARSCNGANGNVDAIVSGHTHLAYNHVDPRNGRPVISSGQYGERFSRMDIQFDKSTKTVTMKNEIFNLWTARPALPGRPRRPPIVDEAVEVANELGSVVLGNATADFGRAVARPRCPVSRCPRTAVASRRSATSSPTCSCGRSTRTALATSTSPS